MKNRLEESINRKQANLQAKPEQKVGPQIVKWLKENPDFEKRVAAKLTTKHKLELKKQVRQRP